MEITGIVFQGSSMFLYLTDELEIANVVHDLHTSNQVAVTIFPLQFSRLVCIVSDLQLLI